MKCLKCSKRAYFSGFCKEHFISYFERKFKSHLSKNRLLSKNEALNIKGENKSAVKHLLIGLGRKVNAEFSRRGRGIESFSLDTKAVKSLANLIRGRKINAETSFLECFTQNEIKAYAEIKQLTINKPKLNNFEKKLFNLMNKALLRRPNIYYCTYKAMKELQKA